MILFKKKNSCNSIDCFSNFDHFKCFEMPILVPIDADRFSFAKKK